MILAVGAAGAGVLALPPIGTAFAGLLDSAQTPSPTLVGLAGSGLLAVVVVVIVVRWGVPETHWAAAWLGLERGAHALVVRPTFKLAHVLAHFDDQVLDRAVEGAGTAAVRLAQRAARIDVRGIDAAVEAVATRVRRLAELARRPQSGLLHQYYLVAVVLLVASVLLLVTVR